MTSTPGDVTVVIPVLDPGPMLLDAIEGVADCREVIVVDNASADGMSEKAAERFDNVHVLRNDVNAGFAPACNRGASFASTPFVLFLNSDARIGPDGIARLLDAADGDATGAIWQPVVLTGDGRVENAGESFTWSGFIVRDRSLPSEHADPYPVFAVTAACVLVRASVFDGIGGFDASYFAYHEDVDLCWRARLSGWDVRVVPSARAVHLKHQTTRRVLEPHEARYLTFRNRLRTILANACPRTIARVLPAYLAGSVFTAALMLATGRGRSAAAIARAWLWPLTHPARMARQRRDAQRGRRRPEYEILGPRYVAPFLGQARRMLADHLRRWEHA